MPFDAIPVVSALGPAAGHAEAGVTVDADPASAAGRVDVTAGLTRALSVGACGTWDGSPGACGRAHWTALRGPLALGVDVTGSETAGGPAVGLGVDATVTAGRTTAIVDLDVAHRLVRGADPVDLAVPLDVSVALGRWSVGGFALGRDLEALFDDDDDADGGASGIVAPEVGVHVGPATATAAPGLAVGHGLSPAVRAGLSFDF